jgi:septum formation protein
MATFKDLGNYRFILASKSPRRQFLLKDLGLNFEVHTGDVDESFPDHLQAQEIPLYLCKKKAEAFDAELDENTIVITADTIVWIGGQVLNKPENSEDAARMLRLLSGNMHEVYTGVCLRSHKKTKAFYSLTKVFFKTLSQDEIDYYISNYNPYDKAGAYGAQEWIGYIAVERIEGSYFNVMGLPLKELYEELLDFHH